MGAKNASINVAEPLNEDSDDEFKFSYGSDSEDEAERKRAEAALAQDIEEKVQFYIDCIQNIEFNTSFNFHFYNYSDNI